MSLPTHTHKALVMWHQLQETGAKYVFSNLPCNIVQYPLLVVDGRFRNSCYINIHLTLSYWCMPIQWTEKSFTSLTTIKCSVNHYDWHIFDKADQRVLKLTFHRVRVPNCLYKLLFRRNPIFTLQHSEYQRKRQ